MATDVTGAHAGSIPDVDADAGTHVAAARRAHQLRFAIIYGTLAAVLVAAVAGVVVFAGRSINPPPAWSSWHPKGGGLGAAQEIAEHVSGSYRLPNGDQLVDVIAKAPSISPSTATIPIHYVAVRGTKGKQDQLYAVSSTNSVMYSLCGLGASCQIATGTASVARGRLVRREILELALYTFKYAKGIQNVIAFMPPSPGKTVKYVVFLRQSDLAAGLKQPLATTLAAKVPLPATIPAREAKLIDATTGPRLYSTTVAQSPQGDLLFVLAPVPA